MRLPYAIAAHAPLFRNLVQREIRQRYKGSALGLAWTLINPLLVVAAYWLVFKFLFGSPIQNFALFLFIGLMVWSLFFGGISVGASSLVNNSSLVTKVRFPREIIPSAAIMANAVIAAAMLVIALPLSIWLTPGSLWPLVLLPIFLVLTLIFTLGLGLLLSALNVYFRDTEHIITALGVPWFFLTPIFYTYDTLPAAAAQNQLIIDVLHWGNPISPFVICVQDTLFFGEWPFWGDALYTVVATAIAAVIGWAAFKRMEGEMAVEL